MPCWSGYAIKDVSLGYTSIKDHELVRLTRPGYNSFSRSLSLKPFVCVGGGPYVLPARGMLARGETSSFSLPLSDLSEMDSDLDIGFGSSGVLLGLPVKASSWV